MIELHRVRFADDTGFVIQHNVKENEFIRVYNIGEWDLYDVLNHAGVAVNVCMAFTHERFLEIYEHFGKEIASVNVSAGV